MIHYVQDGSAAQAQDLQEYDLVLTANGRPVDSLATLQTLAREAETSKSEMSLMLLRLGSVRSGLFVYQTRTLPLVDVEVVGPPEAPEMKPPRRRSYPARSCRASRAADPNESSRGWTSQTPGSLAALSGGAT